MTLLSVISLPLFAADNQLTAQEKAEGWQLLFNGKDLSQWRTFKQPTVNGKWRIEDASITLTAGGGGDLISKKSYSNFELTLDWKISEVGNSGILILADEKGKYIYSHAPEIQILDNERHPDNKPDTHLSGSLYDMIASPAASHKKAGEWNSTSIRLENSALTVWQNDVQTAKVTIGSDEWNSLIANSKFASWPGFAKAKAGHIGLQDHGDKVWFKNIKIKELN
ncbi:MAG: DUF1080 domain-containing protein [Gammaproteobacteria bacterium]|nr:DUF1080 domain-containing protein [Gammaproteobacteria bacterium]MBU2058008.1 DUF1080 domain-containing protein [Gammaproteobacteria bacterium]MBU2174360.1 DUF1080 domain-containing protein [Gammaproteobacteria bacterium]MBU2247576.1 DUF1080 domain-containing protein [Gammaproteobacteria bacterium]MBU2346081.1 DUF1080 domain-containing protein [Gammaproteobacteria bacterium]